MKSLKFSVFGQRVVVERSETGSDEFYPGEGKRRPATDIMIPPDLQEAEIEQYLSDLCHEWATDRHLTVFGLET